MKRLGFLISLILFVVSCAEERPNNSPNSDAFSNGVLGGQVLRKIDVVGTGQEAPTYFSKITVVSSSTDGGPFFVGLENDMQAGYFDFNEKTVQFKSIQGAYKGRESADSTAPIIFQFPVTHHNFQLDESDGKVTNNLVDNKRLPWNRRSQFMIDFANPQSDQFGADMSLGRFGNCYDVVSRNLVDGTVQMEEDGYFSFVTEIVYAKKNCAAIRNWVQGQLNHTVRMRYSFRRMEKNPTYQIMAYEGELDPGMVKYGYFQSVKEEINPEDGRIKNLFLVNRWDPNKQHDFYFTKEFPQEYKAVFNQIFVDTNKLFATRGLNVRFNARENTYGNGKVKEFGDLRYSFINLVDEISPSGPLGYGPSNANPFTGEIISANLNMYTSALKFYLKIINQSAERNRTKFDESDLFKKMKSFLDTDKGVAEWDTKWAQETDIAQLYQHMATKTIYGFPGWHPFTSVPQFNSVGFVADSALPGKQNPNRPGTIGVGVLKDLAQVSGDFVKTLYRYRHTPQGVFSSPKLINATNFAESPIFKKLAEMHRGSPRLPNLEMLKGLNHVVDQHSEHELERINLNRRGHCAYDLESAVAGAERLIIDGIDEDEIIENILYRVGIHELGHNLSLRHNFYGSLDRANFFEPSVPKKNKDGSVITDADGNVEYWPAVSSSVMDYLRLQDEFFAERGWEAYDQAALLFLYSDGKIDMSKDRTYLFCTDEHTLANALCNRFDLGQSPTEVVMSIIKDYEDDYFTRNRRFGRAYWNTAGYQDGVFRAMNEIKEFLPMWRSSFYEAAVRDEAKKLGYDKDTSEQLVIEMEREIKEAIRLSIAFYQAVLQTSNADKPFRNEYVEGTKDSALQRIGISFDKLAAMYFLAGDDSMFYNPNRVLLHNSYMTYRSQPELAEMMEEVLENIVTLRVDMEPWFISFGRGLYAQSAMNFYNRDDESFINKIKVKRYTAEELGLYFGYTPQAQLVADTTVLEKSVDADFLVGEEVAVVRVNAHYYVFSKQGSPFAFDIYKGIKQDEEFGNPSVQGKLDLQELYYIYTLSTGGTI